MEDRSKIISILLIIPVLAIGRVATLTYPDSEPLRRECFGDEDFREWKPAGAMSVENFIYMVEKIERTYRGNAADLIRNLLASFSCNRLGNKQGSPKRDETAKWFEELINGYLNGEPRSPPLELTQEEKCQLFLLLSPAVQFGKEQESSANPKQDYYGFGVLSLKGDVHQAIDMSKVLYGIIAGLRREKLVNLVNGDDAEKVNLLYASTISEVINAAITKVKAFTAENYAEEGMWYSNLCTRRYLYRVDEFIWPKTAEVLGAIDGFIIGSKINDMENKDKVKLSQILRMYYSQDGLRDDTTDPNGASYCSRNLGLIEPELEKQTINYMTAYHKKIAEAVEDNDRKAVRDYVQQFKSVYTELVQGKDKQEECQKNSGVDICETPSNVFVVLDQRNENITFEKNVTGDLINMLNIGLDEDTITIYSNADIENLHTLINASDSKADALCVLEDFEQYALPPAQDSKVLTDIKNIMTVYEENQKLLQAVPSKVVVYFNFGELKEEKRVMEKARRELKSRHPNLKIIPIGSNKEYLEAYFTNNQPSRMISWNEADLVHKLEDKVCLAPAVLQHPNCKTRSKYEDSEYKGYIGNYRVHHWAMYPQYFLKTFGYKFQFQAQYGKIRVCFSRREPARDSGEHKDCKETSGVGEPVEFSGRDPCKGRTVHNCDPFYFSIFGRHDNEKSTCRREIDGDEVGCKRLDLIEYTIKHEGISCSSGRKIISSPFLQALLAFLVICYILSQQK